MHSVMNRIIMPGSIKNHGKNWKDVDYLVFNTYIWWMNTNTMKVLRGSFNKGDTEYDEIDRPVAYKRVLSTWSKWVNKNVNPNRTTVFFKSLDWNNPDGIKCALETTPILNRSMHLNVGTDLRLYVVAGNITRNMKVPNHFIDITTLSEYRKDAHTAVHTIRQGKILTPEQKADPAAYADCIHWSSDWNILNRNRCAKETLPVTGMSKPPNIGTNCRQFQTVADVTEFMKIQQLKGLPSLSTSKACVPTYIISVFFLDITTLSKYRKDAHTAVYTTGQGKFITLEHHADPATYANCIYWCLPGLP
ncbi:hypothetical protein V6N11_053708 [Hibiscus sabdariffa]|uniref:Trichome birefringence-like C-terminal domain-containing protein n=1 Tax=Hibiscus sabdariffa TaxID=183260 RepID=A0ABR2S1R7_9ROSI